MAQVGLNMASKWPPRGLKKVQDDFQDGSRAPKRLRDGQEFSRTAQDGLKTAQEAPKKPQEDSKNTPKIAPILPLGEEGKMDDETP